MMNCWRNAAHLKKKGEGKEKKEKKGDKKERQKKNRTVTYAQDIADNY